jgi:glucose/arabinose dehydrogenase
MGPANGVPMNFSKSNLAKKFGFPKIGALLWTASLFNSLTLAASLPAGFTETKLIGGINPTTLEITPDGRVFLCEKTGRITVYKNGNWLPTPLLTVDADYVEERGLLGLVLDPNFTQNQFIYIYYCAKNPSHNRVSRFKVNGDVVTDPEKILIELPNLIALRSGGWHNGGSIQFGKDGKLYIATGNNTIRDHSKSLDIVLGKILRINSDGTIPTDNPFYATTTDDNRAIWALGLRNPFTTAINPVTGKFIINDVGDGSAEEINEGKAGYNYGYPDAEGHATNLPAGMKGTYGDPLTYYGHGDGCAIAGATFYHPPANTFGPTYTDLFFYADYCGGWIKTMDPANGNSVKSFATNINRPINIKVGPDGRMYYVARGNKAAGIGSGSAEDNTSTADGSLFVIKGSAIPTVNLSSLDGKGRIALGSEAYGIILPEGKRKLKVFDLAGKMVWEFSRSSATSITSITLPLDLQNSIYWVKSE